MRFATYIWISRQNCSRRVEERTISRVGSLQEISVDVRIIAATNKDLQEEINEGRFREDLFYRLNVVSIVLPPLSERKEDIPMLAEYFLKRVVLQQQKEEMYISPDALEVLKRYSWPGQCAGIEKHNRTHSRSLPMSGYQAG